MTNLSITTHNNLFASKHDVGGPLQTERGAHTHFNHLHTHVYTPSADLCEPICLLTRPGWTHGSSRGCQTSAWWPSHWRSWLARTACRPWRVGTVWGGRTHRHVQAKTGTHTHTQRIGTWHFLRFNDSPGSCTAALHGRSNGIGGESGRWNFSVPALVIIDTVCCTVWETLSLTTGQQCWKVEHQVHKLHKS